MRAPAHALPASVFDAIAAGGGGGDGVDRLRAAQYSKNLMLTRLLITLAEARQHPHRVAVAAAYRALATLRRTSADAVAAVLCYPPVSAWAMETTMLLRRDEPAGETHPGLLAAVAVAVALRARAPLELEVPLDPRAPGVLTLPTLGVLGVPDNAATLRVQCTDGVLRVTGKARSVRVAVDGGTPGWRRTPVVSVEHDGLRLRLLLDTHGWRHAPHTLAAGAHTLSAEYDHDLPVWRRRLGTAWRLLVRHHRPVAQEVSAAFRVLAPLVTPPAGLNSGTFHHAFGSVAMSLPPSYRLAAVALAHEIQHTKLAALMDLFALTEPGPDDRFYAPWRSDPRPLVGLLHGTYAHLGVAGFWRRQRHHETDPEARLWAEVEFARWTTAAHEVTQVLRNQPRLTPFGQRLVYRMAEVLEAWRHEPVSQPAASLARDLAEKHRRRWQPPR